MEETTKLMDRFACPVCGLKHSVKHVKDCMYLAEERIMLSETVYWNCVDCVRCGCQIKIQRVLPRAKKNTI